MCCFMAPAATAIVTSGIKKKIPKEYEIGKLNTMLWGGVSMLIIEHIAHKEVVPYFPFFTAGWSEMWPEIVKVGIPMTMFIFVVWGSMVAGKILSKRKSLKISET